MTQKTKLTIAIIIAATITMVICRLLEIPPVEITAKMTASSAFVALALMLCAHRSRYGRMILAGLVLSWCGDLFLAGSAENLFVYGLGSFLLAHIAYTSAFVSVGIKFKWALGALVPIVALSVGMAIWLASYVPDELAIPVRVYTAVISLMVITAAGARGAGATLLIPVGAILFYLSDLSVAAGQFVQADFPNYVWGLPFYFSAQVLLALSVRTSSAAPTM